MDVTIKPDMAANFKVAKVAREPIAMVQEVSGRIEANERQVTRIGAGVTGRVTQVLAEVGRERRDAVLHALEEEHKAEHHRDEPARHAEPLGRQAAL